MNFFCEEAKFSLKFRAKKRIYFLIGLLLIVASSFHIDLFQFESDPTGETQERSETTNFVCTNHTRKERSKMPKRKRKNEDGTKKEKKYKGVAKTKSGRFQATIRIDGKTQALGTFDTAKQAARAYDRAAMEAGRPPTTLNYQDKVPMDYKPKKRKLRSTNTIGYRGVYKNGNRFQASIKIDDKMQYLGSFGTTKEAAIAFDLAAIQAKRPKSDLNFPDMIHVKKEIPRIKKRKLVRCTNTTGFNGVSKYKKKFQAQISINGKIKHLGTFTRARDAAMAYDKAIVKYHQPRTKFNFPDGMPLEDQYSDEDGYWM